MRGWTPRSRTSPATPMSTGNTSVPARRAMRQTQLSPFVKFSVTTAVTSWPVCVTPSATTPLSAHMMTRAFFSISISGSAWIPAIRTIFLSKTPRLPSGFATWLQRSWARAMAPGSGVMCKCFNSSVSVMSFFSQRFDFGFSCQFPFKVSRSPRYARHRSSQRSSHAGFEG